MATVLAVDKDALQLELIAFLLKQEGHRVHATCDPDQALDILQTKLIDLVIMETALQRHDGLKLCQQMRRLNPYTPLMIVSERQEEDQIVKGLETAADDYLTKPYSPRMLLAHVRVHLRRSGLSRGGRSLDDNLSIGEISLNLQRMCALVNGRQVDLTPRELTLLHALMDNAGRVLSRDQLTELAWGHHFAGTTRSIDVYIVRLKRKLQPYLTGGTYIQALRGFGYKFEIPRPQQVAN
jgi:two-component system alkaline phosphatase synthesis response regulator PhoP